MTDDASPEKLDGTRAAEFLIANIPEDGKTDSGRRNRRYVDSMVDIVIALGETGAVQAVEPLLEALSDYYSEVRECAYEALIEIGRPAVPALVEALSAEDSATRSGVGVALKEIGWEPDTDKLKALYLIALEDWHGCIKLGEPAVEPLIKALYVFPLTQFPWEATQVILDLRVGAADTLGWLGNERAVEPLNRILEADDNVIEDEEYTTVLLLAAVNARRKIGKPAVEPLINALERICSLTFVLPLYYPDDNENLREAAKEALRELGHEVE